MTTQRATIFEVQGMSCPSCIRHIRAALTEHAGVTGVDVKLRDGLVVVDHDPAQTSVTQLIAALDEAGYPATARPM